VVRRQEPEEVGHDVRLPGGVHPRTGAGSPLHRAGHTTPTASASPQTTPASRSPHQRAGQTGDAGHRRTARASLEEYCPPIPSSITGDRDRRGDAAGTFFDLATIHVAHDATLNRLRELYPQGRFEVRAPAQHRRASRER